MYVCTCLFPPLFNFFRLPLNVLVRTPGEYAYPRLGITALGGWRIQTRTAEYAVPEVRNFASSENATRQPDRMQHTQQLLSNLLVV
jgi:hypothetical protein